MNGTNTRKLEEHLSEIMWRYHHKHENTYRSFFEELSDIYDVSQAAARLTAPKPLFHTWAYEDGQQKVHQIYDTRHAPANMNIAVQTASHDHPYNAAKVLLPHGIPLDIPETESEKTVSLPDDFEASIPET